ncbi:hypothetical protein AOCH_000074 [Aspergillus ochraceoroseus]|uniref:Carboxylic ester hydrolase n=1 Tax=Aspergillus ochraceoroseus TaxID=138278 RepID=A0A0F8XPU0_9EURO|nr:hypothetical protein AOCH_000074 [Aspergillus ochraceoroseus]
MRFGPISLFAAGFSGLVAARPVGPEEPLVDLGYATYQGYYNDAHRLNIWKGQGPRTFSIISKHAPAAPPQDNENVTMAVDQPPVCPQSGAAGTPAVYGFNSGLGDEDCLFLNVYAAPGASGLPVLLWIHGGGYALFGAVYDPSSMMNTNDNKFITVEIQYRLGAFGFLSSDEVKAHGQANAGLLDQRFAMEWIRKHIAKFGGDPSRVTIGGESSGAGAVMLHSLAYGGRESRLFDNIIAASPYSPPIYEYNDEEPSNHYNSFAELAGCGCAKSAGYSSTFDCLVEAPTAALQNASALVSTSGLFGTFAFLPVIDGDYIRARPSQQLLEGRVSGQRILVGNNANDGVPLSNPNVVSREAFANYISSTFPRLTEEDKFLLNEIYLTRDSQPSDDGPRFDTLGDCGPTALNQSEMATGLQQTVFNIFAESTFDCSAQWLAEAFSEGPHSAWKYQYSVTPAYHGADLAAYFSDAVTDFNHAFQKIWGNFIIHNTPVISLADATADKPNATAPIGPHQNLLWPEFTPFSPWQMDLNTTGGYIKQTVVTPNLTYYLREGDGIVNTFRLADAYAWEGGRGDRCSFWRAVSARVPL